MATDDKLVPIACRVPPIVATRLTQLAVWMEHHGPVLFEGVLVQWQVNPERTVQ